MYTSLPCLCCTDGIVVCKILIYRVHITTLGIHSVSFINDKLTTVPRRYPCIFVPQSEWGGNRNTFASRHWSGTVRWSTWGTIFASRLTQAQHRPHNNFVLNGDSPDSVMCYRQWRAHCMIYSYCAIFIVLYWSSYLWSECLHWKCVTSYAMYITAVYSTCLSVCMWHCDIAQCRLPSNGNSMVYAGALANCSVYIVFE